MLIECGPGFQTDLCYSNMPPGRGYVAIVYAADCLSSNEQLEMLRRSIAICCAMVSISACATLFSHGHAGATSSVCSLSAGHVSDAGKEFRIRAVFVSDGQEFSALKDPKCPTEVLLPYIAESSDEHVDPGVDAFRKLLNSSMGGSQVLLDISGKYLQPNDENMVGQFVIYKVWSSQVLVGNWRDAEIPRGIP